VVRSRVTTMLSSPFPVRGVSVRVTSRRLREVADIARRSDAVSKGDTPPRLRSHKCHSSAGTAPHAAGFTEYVSTDEDRHAHGRHCPDERRTRARGIWSRETPDSSHRHLHRRTLTGRHRVIGASSRRTLTQPATTLVYMGKQRSYSRHTETPDGASMRDV
jgi:hypothetical protein